MRSSRAGGGLPRIYDRDDWTRAFRRTDDSPMLTDLKFRHQADASSPAWRLGRDDFCASCRIARPPLIGPDDDKIPIPPRTRTCEYLRLTPTMRRARISWSMRANPARSFAARARPSLFEATKVVEAKGGQELPRRGRLRHQSGCDAAPTRSSRPSPVSAEATRSRPCGMPSPRRPMPGGRSPCWRPRGRRSPGQHAAVHRLEGSGPIQHEQHEIRLLLCAPGSGDPATLDGVIGEAFSGRVAELDRPARDGRAER